MRGFFPVIRSPERRLVAGSFVALLGIMAAHALQETARDALFLAVLPPTRLPWVYLGIAVLSSVVYFLHTKGAARLRTRGALALWLALSAGVTLGFWTVVDEGRQWALYAFYIWSGVFATMSVVEFWLAVGELFTVGQARRLFGLIGAGSVSGAILGTGLASALTFFFDARSLLLAASVILGVVAAILLLFLPPAAAPSPIAPPRADFRRSLESIWEQPYLRGLAAITFLSTVVFTHVDFIFKTAVALHVPAQSLDTFFAVSYLGLNLLSLVVQVLLVSWAIRALGPAGSLSIFPLILVLGAGGTLLWGGLLSALVLKGFDGAFRHSLHRTATEVLYVSLSDDLRSSVKGYIESLGFRGGQAVASLLILMLIPLGELPRILAVLVMILGGLWFAVAFVLRRHYLDVLRTAVDRAATDTQARYPRLDLASVEALVTALDSQDEDDVLSAISLLVEQNRTRLISRLFLQHSSPRVLARVLEVFAENGREEALPEMTRLLAEHPDAEVRSAALRAVSRMVPESKALETARNDPSPLVRAAALIAIFSRRSGHPEEADQAIARVISEGTPEEKTGLVRAIRSNPGAGHVSSLLGLAATDDPMLLAEVAEAMREAPDPAFAPALVRMLKRRQAREPARLALVGLGEVGWEALTGAFSDPSVGQSIRRQIPESLGRLGARKAGPFLLDRLLVESDGQVRFRILRTLGRLRDANPDLDLAEEKLLRATEDTLHSVFRLLNRCWLLEQGAEEDPRRATPIQGLLVNLMHHKMALDLERVFRLVGLLHPYENVRNIYRGLRSPDPKLRSVCRELLGHLALPAWREMLMAAVDDADLEEKVGRARDFQELEHPSYEELLGQLLVDEGRSVCCLVAHHVSELGLSGFRGQLEALAASAEGALVLDLERTARRLAEVGAREGES